MIFKVALAENPKDEELNQLYQQAKSDEIISRVSGLAM